MSRYAVIIEGNGDKSYSAFVPGLPGCVAAGDSIEEVERLIREAAQLHVDSLRAHGEPVPTPGTAAVTEIEVE
ncbi:MAG TPA: type II toxin-antitoxin system HicB family antitoxin [Acidimicrobiia bacterium]|nr:type II toxin-antitoxin system HicB family antitoxin [Acidimicrobiia bacterium]